MPSKVRPLNGNYNTNSEIILNDNSDKCWQDPVKKKSSLLFLRRAGKQRSKGMAN